MMVFRTAALVVFALVLVSRTTASDGRVVSLDPSNFAAIAKDPDTHVFVKFYTPWCAHCKDVAPVWEFLSQKLQDRQDIVVAEVNAEEHKLLAKSEKANGFPTFLYYTKQGKVGIPYKGPRTIDGFESFARKLGHY